MQKILEKLAPKPLQKVLQAYINIWQNIVDRENTPLISLFLQQGSIVSGEIIHIDFVNEIFSLWLLSKSESLNVMFIDFKAVQTFTLHDLDKYEAFVQELAKL